MHIIILLIIAIVLLFTWLVGHWLARVVAFLLFMPMLGLLGAVMTGSDIPGQPNNAWLGLLIGIALAWPVASIPTWVRRAQAARMRDASLADAPVSLTFR